MARFSVLRKASPAIGIHIKNAGGYYIELDEKLREFDPEVVEPWMVWPGWKSHIGCDRCRQLGGVASCWGIAGCHGRIHNCGCKICQA